MILLTSVFSGDPKSTSFDVPLMITLLRNLTKLAPPARGYDYLPMSTDTTLTGDLARVKYYRNEVAHNKTAKINTAFFTTAWDDIAGVRILFITLQNYQSPMGGYMYQ